MATLPAEQADWLRSFIAAQRWVFARTYAKTYPHEYIVRPDDGPARSAWWRFRDLITSFGHIEDFYKTARPYLVLDGWKYWWITPVINRARPPDKTWGSQVSSRTASSRPATDFDFLAPRWDRISHATVEEHDAIVTLLENHVVGTVLDVGCGTGALLDALSIPVSRYVGIDPSSGMLNVHVLKHPRHHVVPATLGEYAASPFDTVTAIGGAASLLSADEIAKASALAKRVLVAVFQADSPLSAALSLPGAVGIHIGKWSVVVRPPAQESLLSDASVAQGS